jgi:ATPase subunit of ABC transporter with duplicated ATPase domains
MVSHDKSLLEQIAHRIVYIEDGQVKKEQASRYNKGVTF